MLQEKVDRLLLEQTQEWDLAKTNYTGLQKALKKQLQLSQKVTVGVQFNAERIYSSAAKVDSKSISERKCFLCKANLPEQQRMIDFGKDYYVLVNPFPIFPRHLTIPHRDHTPQLIEGRIDDMLSLARELPDYTIFYNGPACGASAPDHFHFQAGNKGFLPIEEDFNTIEKSVIKGTNGCRAMYFRDYMRHCIILHGNDKDVLAHWFEQLYLLMQEQYSLPPEPMMNILACFEAGIWKLFIFPRRLHRPWQFFEEGDRKILLSPASVDLGGMLIIPREEDFQKLTVSDITDIFDQVSWPEADFNKLISNFSKQ